MNKFPAFKCSRCAYDLTNWLEKASKFHHDALYNTGSDYGRVYILEGIMLLSHDFVGLITELFQSFILYDTILIWEVNNYRSKKSENRCSS